MVDAGTERGLKEINSPQCRFSALLKIGGFSGGNRELWDASY